MKTAMKTQCWFVALGLAISITAFAQVEQAWVAHCTNGAGALAMKVSSAGNVHVTGPVGTVKYDAGGDQIWNTLTGGVALAVDTAANVYVASTAIDTNGTVDFLTVKLDSSGHPLWSRQYDGPNGGDDQIRAMALDGAGNLYVTGASGGYFAIRNSAFDFATIKYDREGHELWVARYDGPIGRIDNPIALAIDRQDNVYVTGVTDFGCNRGIGCSGATATVKYDTEGRLLWIADLDAYPSGLAVDSTGNVVVTGSGGCSDSVTTKHDSNGQQVWFLLDDYDPASVFPRGLAVDNVGNVVVSGTVSGFNLATTEYFLACVTAKCSGDGRRLWVARVPDADCVAMKMDQQGGVLVLGRVQVNESESASLMTKYDANGNQLWQARLTNSWPVALEIDDAGGIYVVANTETGFRVAKYVEFPLVGLPTIVSPPTGQTVGPGAIVSLAVVADGLGPLNYQWRFDGRAISGATNATLVFANVEPASEGNYSVEVSNAIGTTVSPEARVTVLSRFTSALVTPEGWIELTLVAHAGFFYVIEYSEDLVTWLTLADFVRDDTGTIHFTDYSAASSRQRFYRAIKQVYCPGPT